MIEQELISLLAFTVLPFAIGLLLLRILLHARLANIAVDQPNQRSLHTVPVPRTGGLAIMSAMLFSWMAMAYPWLMPFAICSLLLSALSFMDVLHGLSAAWRFVAHCIVAGAFVATALPASPFWLMAVLTMALVWMINLYNFMDGSDGLAGGMALFGFGTYAVAGWLGGDEQLALACLAVAVSAAAFLLYNFHPARIFMGDAGSIPLGFLVGALGVYGFQKNLWALWFPLLVFSPFVVDATVTLLKRLLRGEKVWQAHRSHYYQRLVQMGWGHRNTAIAEYVLMLAAGGSAVLLLHQSMLMVLLALTLWAMVYGVILWLIDRLWAARVSL